MVTDILDKFLSVDFLKELMSIADIIAGELDKRNLIKQGGKEFEVKAYRNLDKLMSRGLKAKRDAERDIRKRGVRKDEFYRD